jgi:hypothetical protein
MRSGEFEWRGGKGAVPTIRRGSSGSFEGHPGTPVPSAPYCPSFLTTESKPPRGSRGPDDGDRRSWEVERNDPGRIRQALTRAGSGQVGHGPWELVLT